MKLRELDLSDIDAICAHRTRMFIEAGHQIEKVAAMTAPFRRWLEEALSDGRYFGYAAHEDRELLGAVGLMELAWPPHPAHPTDARRGYVLNLFVEPEYRGRGIAAALMEAADREFERRGIGYAILHATAAGKPLYERTGWTGTGEMAKTYA
jgi:GNAT superfamily N-acetyltransferase